MSGSKDINLDSCYGVPQWKSNKQSEEIGLAASDTFWTSSRYTSMLADIVCTNRKYNIKTVIT